MKKIMSILCWFIFFVPLVSLSENITFSSAEHIFAGDEIILRGLPSSNNQPIRLPIENGLTLTYGEIIAMPDFYGSPHHQISSEKTWEARKNRFTTIFSNFSHSDTKYFYQFWPIIQDERKQVASALKAHQDVSKLYEKLDKPETIAVIIATDGQYLRLNETCFDHFNSDAVSAYQAGHAVAIDTALLGYQIQSGKNDDANAYCRTHEPNASCLYDLAQQKLIFAYEQNAFANHYLTDRFAAGHMRTPFRALEEKRPIPLLGGVSGGMMHNEDGRFGLIVTNDSGKYWMAYGDHYYFSDQNKKNKAILKETLQISADEIDQAYQSGVDPDPLSQKIIDMIPKPVDPGRYIKTPDFGPAQQSSPLYLVMLDDQVWQRTDVNDRYDYQWTPLWFTLVTLFSYHLSDQPLSYKWEMILKKNHLLESQT